MVHDLSSNIAAPTNNQSPDAWTGAEHSANETGIGWVVSAGDVDGTHPLSVGLLPSDARVQTKEGLNVALGGHTVAGVDADAVASVASCPATLGALDA